MREYSFLNEYGALDALNRAINKYADETRRTAKKKAEKAEKEKAEKEKAEKEKPEKAEKEKADNDEMEKTTTWRNG
jgi:uncharacterized membrane protein YukC